MTVSGVLDTWTTMVIIYGASFGGGLITYLMATGFKGSSRQIMMFQVLFNAGTGLVLFFFFFLERYYQLPFIHAFVTSLKVDLAQQMAFIYLIFNVLGAIVMFVFRAPILRKIQHFCPPSTEDNIGKLEYLHDRAFDTPDLALDLAEKEVFQFFCILPEQIDALRSDAETGENTSDALTRALDQRHESIEEALSELSQYVSAEDSESLIDLANRNRILGSLHSSIDNFSNSVLAANKSEHLSLLAATVVEAFDASLCLALDAARESNLKELEIVWKSTDDKSDKMRNIRSRFLTGGVGLSDSERLDLMALTTSLERVVWVLHELLGDMLTNGREVTA
jgi:phosphate:Na+ symporter